MATSLRDLERRNRLNISVAWIQKYVKNVNLLINSGTLKQVGIAGVSIPGRWHTFIFPPLPCRMNLGPTQLRTGDSFPKVKRPESAADLSLPSNFEIENVRTFAPCMFMTWTASPSIVLQISSKYFKGYQCQNRIILPVISSGRLLPSVGAELFGRN
jgi:hypothetical protein